MDTYLQIAASRQVEGKVKGSRFIGEAMIASDEPAAMELLTQIRKREYNATHHCWAFRVGQDGDRFRYSDDGEPSGSAGQPIMRQIDGRQLTNVLVVVTRYYGGTRLGTGGLVRAYGNAASEVLDLCGVKEHIIREQVLVQFDYADTSPAMHTIDGFDAPIVQSDYGDNTRLTLAIRKSEVEAFKATFIENLAGRGKVESAE